LRSIYDESPDGRIADKQLFSYTILLRFSSLVFLLSSLDDLDSRRQLHAIVSISARMSRYVVTRIKREIVVKLHSNELTDVSLSLSLSPVKMREERNLRAYRSLGLASRSVALVINRQRDFLVSAVVLLPVHRRESLEDFGPFGKRHDVISRSIDLVGTRCSYPHGASPFGIIEARTRSFSSYQSKFSSRRCFENFKRA